MDSVRGRAANGLEPARRIDHVAVVVRDADSAVARFVSDFGLTVSGDTATADDRVRLVYLEAGDTTLQLVEPLSPGPIAEWLDQHGEGLHHICLDVPDLHGYLATLRGEANGQVSAGGRGCPVAFLRARPHGVIVELTETGGPVQPHEPIDRGGSASHA